MKKFILSVFIGFVIFSCAPSRFVKPLKKSEQAAAFTFGGPLIKFAGAPVPIPFTTLGYAYGINNNLSCFANLHSTALVFGNLQGDLGTTIALINKENKYGVSVSPAIQTVYNIRNKTGFRIWPSLDINTFFHLKNKPSYFYTGINSWIELSSKKAFGETQTRHVMPNLHLGYTIVKTKWQHQFEIKYLGTGVPNLPGVVDYIGIAGKGSLGMYYCLMRKF